MSFSSCLLSILKVVLVGRSFHPGAPFRYYQKNSTTFFERFSGFPVNAALLSYDYGILFSSQSFFQQMKNEFLIKKDRSYIELEKKQKQYSFVTPYKRQYQAYTFRFDQKIAKKIFFNTAT